MAYNKGLHGSNGNGGNQRARSYLLILLITFGAALLGVMLLHRVRERRIYNLLVKQKDHHLLTLQLLLQKERERTKELSRKNEDMKAKVYALRSQKIELGRTIVEMQSTLDSLKDEQKLIESAFEEKQEELRMMMQQKGTNLGQGGSDIRALRENLKRKEAEIEDLKHRLVETPVNETYPVNIHRHSTIFPHIVTANRTMEAQNKTENDDKGKEQSAKYGGDDKHVTNENASKSKLITEFKDGEVRAEMKSEIRNNAELGNKNEGSAGATAKEIDAEVVEDRQKKAFREQLQGQVENNSHGGRQDFDVKQLSGEKRKHGHLSRTKGKRWRTIVKNKLMENNRMFESQGEVNMGNRKVYRDEKDELKDTTVGRESDVKKFTRQNEARDSGNHENGKDGNNTTVENHLVTTNETNTYPEKQSLDKIRNSEEEHEEGLVQQNWSRRRINNAGQTKSNVLDDEPEELEVSDAQNQEKDAIDAADDEDDDNNDDFFKESHSEFDDEREEYKEELDESEFQHGL